uniref:Uncharacterized protein n=1 Tax=Siphoviridae sp. ctEIp38 TaxID=2825394 RepID=A0A8S5QE23_9CAUD|nr:MAG TPA: hypothetical protein [Siphoviridae sp. ctEIp38]
MRRWLFCLWQLPACLCGLPKPLMRGVPLACIPSKSHIGRFVLHIPLKG